MSALMIPAISFAHPGRTDSSGCHTCKTNCSNWGLSSGEYHCHNAKALPQPKEPIKSVFGEQGTGYTKPAPEYKIPATVKKINKPVEQKPISTTPQKKIEIVQEIKTETPALQPVQPVVPVKKKGFWAWIFGF